MSARVDLLLLLLYDYSNGLQVSVCTLWLNESNKKLAWFSTLSWLTGLSQTGKLQVTWDSVGSNACTDVDHWQHDKGPLKMPPGWDILIFLFKQDILEGGSINNW